MTEENYSRHPELAIVSTPLVGEDPGNQTHGFFLRQNDEVASSLESRIYNLESILTRYIDFASLGTVADCMPLVGENRVITALGLRQMRNSDSSALRKFIENSEKDPEWDADIIGFQLGPRINAAGRMDSPLKALHWLLATEDKVDDWLLEVESLNAKRQEEVKRYTEDALMNVDTSLPVLFYMHEDIEHGLIGLVAGRLTEAYGKPSIVLCRQHRSSWLDIRNSKLTDNEKEISKREYEVQESSSHEPRFTSHALVASCRSPEWCNLVELLDECKDYFVRYGGHRQAAGFTIEASRFAEFQWAIAEKFAKRYDIANLPKKTIKVECILDSKDVSLTTLDMIDRFRPFGIGNQKPLFVLRDLTVKEVKVIGKGQNHLSLIFAELPSTKCLLWNYSELFPADPAIQQSSDPLSPISSLLSPMLPSAGDILSPIVSLERNIWNKKVSIQMMMKSIVI